MANVLPIDNELGGHSLTWQCPPVFDFRVRLLSAFGRASSVFNR